MRRTDRTYLQKNSEDSIASTSTAYKTLVLSIARHGPIHSCYFYSHDHSSVSRFPLEKTTHAVLVKIQARPLYATDISWYLCLMRESALKIPP